jgi:putrescine transport system permease protein
MQSRAPATWRGLLLFPVILPFWTSFLIRVCAWIAILKPNGLLNGLLIAAGLITTLLPLLNNNFSVELGPVYSYLPFMILPLYGSLSALDESLIEAAADLGPRPSELFFAIPELLGGPVILMIGNVLWDECFNSRDWPVASAVAVALVAAVVVPILLAQKFLERE